MIFLPLHLQLQCAMLCLFCPSFNNTDPHIHHYSQPASQTDRQTDRQTKLVPHVLGVIKSIGTVWLLDDALVGIVSPETHRRSVRRKRIQKRYYRLLANSWYCIHTKYILLHHSPGHRKDHIDDPWLYGIVQVQYYYGVHIKEDAMVWSLWCAIITTSISCNNVKQKPYSWPHFPQSHWLFDW